MMKIFIWMLLGSVAINTYAQKPLVATAKTTAVTVYMNAAEINQMARVSIPAGTHEVVINNVASNLNENSIRISASESATVLSTQFTNNYKSEYQTVQKTPKNTSVQDSIVCAKRKLEEIEKTKETYTKTMDLLDKNPQTTGIAPGINVTDYMKLVDFYSSKSNEINAKLLALSVKSDSLNTLISSLTERLTSSPPMQEDEKEASGKLILQIMNKTAGEVQLNLSYISNTATWRPIYDLRAKDVSSPINMLYKAQVVQRSGIDWKNVKLTLSSGSPSENNEAPLLRAWFLRYQEHIAPQNITADEYNNSISALSLGNVGKRNLAVTQFSSLSDHTTIAENQLNISFNIDIPYDILSNGKVHTVALKEITIPATYKYYAVPKLDPSAYLLAQVSNYSQYNLLPGAANIIFGGMYVGKTTINPNDTGDTLNLNMGKDEKISIKREKVVDKSGTKFLSSYKEQTYTYDIIVRNNKSEKINMILKDQYPLSSNNDITVTVLETSNASVNAELGVLTWNVALAPNETKKVRMSYIVRYPKDKTVE